MESVFITQANKFTETTTVPLPPPIHRQVAMNSKDSSRINLKSLAQEIVKTDPINTPRHLWAQNIIRTMR